MKKKSICLYLVVELPLLSEISKCRHDPNIDVVVSFLLRKKEILPPKSGTLCVS